MFASCANEALKCPDSILFTVRVSDDIQYSFQEVALIGDHPALGAWNSQLAIVMSQCSDDPKKWMAKVRLPIGIVVRYRYFITAVDCETPESGGVGGKQIHRWESSTNARAYKVMYRVQKPTETFGVVDGDKKEVSYGWLTCGRLIQFTFGHFAIKMTAKNFDSLNYKIKIQLLNASDMEPMSARPKAYTEYTNLVYGESCLLPQPDGGIPYPGNTIVVFQTRVSDLPRVAYELQLRTPGGYIFAYTRIAPKMLQKSAGQLELEIISRESSKPIGTVNLSFVVIAPPLRSRHEFVLKFTKWVKSDDCLDVGYRGLGQSLKVAENRAPLTENTIGSLNAAASVGADMVVIDIGLTKDKVPVIYHDFSINVFKRAIGGPRKPDDLMEVCIDTLTYKELKNLKTFYYVDGVMRKNDAYNELRESEKDRRLFVTLQDMFEHINPSVSFGLNIKWPQRLANGEVEAPTYHDKNLFVDCILEVIERCRKNRFVMIMSRDAGICAMFRYKQNIMPVLFQSSDEMLLSKGGPQYADSIAQTVSATMHYAKSFDLAGIVPHASWITYDIRLVGLAHKLGLKVLIWGKEMKDAKAIINFKRLELDGVMYDRMDLWCTKKECIETKRASAYTLKITRKFY